MEVFFGIVLFAFIIMQCKGEPQGWEDAWSYDGLLDAKYWGQIHTEWETCRVGEMQSPVNLPSRKLLYDPNLPRLEVHHTRDGKSSYEIGGQYSNTGRAPVFRPYFNESNEEPLRISRGPLHYHYRFHELRIHFGQNPDEGSEHTVDGKSFQGEIHMTFWNDQLYRDFESARNLPQGLAILSIFLQMTLNETSHFELTKLTHFAIIEQIIHKGDSINITNINFLELLPNTMEYITYEGSMTIPPCYESVTWIIFNKPIHIAQSQLDNLRELLKTRKEDNPRTITRNIRQKSRVGSRALRTNIAHVYDLDEKCYQNRVEHTYRATMMT